MAPFSLLLLLCLARPSLSTDYCRISPKHTMCQYQGQGRACGSRVLGRGVTEEEKRTVLEVHNKLRALLARGEERRGRPGPQPGAANMRQMEWDEELAMIAQRHADQCQFEHDCADCRSVNRFGVGQNLYIYKQSLRLPATDWEKAVHDWYDEVRLFSRSHVKPFRFKAAIGHYSQMAWADTDKVGCGVTSYREGKWFSTLYTCNYGPNGNYIRGEMYREGRSCSACPSGTSCSTSYPGLCASHNTPFLRPGTLPPVKVTTRRTTIPTTRHTTRRTTRRPTKKPTTKPITTRYTTTRPTITRPTTNRPTTTRPTTTRKTTPTTTRLPRPTASPIVSKEDSNSFLNSSIVKPLLFTCDFEATSDSCEIRNTGTNWTLVESEGNRFYQTELQYKTKTEIYFKNMISPAKDGLVCLDFKYQKFSIKGRKSSLQAVVWPYRGKPGKISVFRDSPRTGGWVRAQITFRKIDTYFLVMFRAGGPSTKTDSIHMAIDQVAVLPGKCSSVDL